MWSSGIIASKRAVAQELMLRRQRGFRQRGTEYRRFLAAMWSGLNAGRRQRLGEEMTVMRELPERRMESARRDRVKVDSGQPDLCGPQRILGAEPVDRRAGGGAAVHGPCGGLVRGRRRSPTMPRLRGLAEASRGITGTLSDWLVRKPGRLEHYRYRDELFPTSRFRMTFDLLEEQFGRYQGSQSNTCRIPGVVPPK